MPLPGFPYATIVGFGVLVIAAGLFMLFGNQQQVPIGYGNTTRRGSGSPPPTRGSWSHPSAREPSRSHSQGSARSGTTRKRRTSEPSDKKNAGYSCIICLDCEELSRFVSLCCGHHFHANCLIKWFQASQRGKVCPTCNTVATSH